MNTCISEQTESVFADGVIAAFQQGTCIQRRRPVRASDSIQEAAKHSHSHTQPPGAHGGHTSPFVLLGIISIKKKMGSVISAHKSRVNFCWNNKQTPMKEVDGEDIISLPDTN